MEHEELRATNLLTVNSLSYVRHLFALNAARRLLVSSPTLDVDHILPDGLIEQHIVPTAERGWYRETHELIHDELPAQIAFTSGTEGSPQGIVLSHSNLTDVAERIVSQMSITDEIREYVGVPVTFSFGMGRVRAISAVGGHSYLPPHGFDPSEFARMLLTNEVNALSAVPTLLRVLLRYPQGIQNAGKHLRWMEIGSQYMSAAEKRDIRDLFPNAYIVQHYGLTEASRTTFLPISTSGDDLLHSVGRPSGTTEVDISSEGRIRVRGPHVGKWRVGRKQIHALTDSNNWLTTNDLGHIRDGSLFFDGRSDDQINCGGVKISPELLELRIQSFLNHSSRIVAAKIHDQLHGDGVLVVAESPDVDIDLLRTATEGALKEYGLVAASAVQIQKGISIPQTATRKPLRRLLTKQYNERNSPTPLIVTS